MNRGKNQAILDAYILSLAILAFFTLWWTPYSGDDWAYMGAFSGANAKFESWLNYPKWVWGHWMTTNGRLANYIAPILLNIPYKCVPAIMCAGMQWLMFKMSAKCTGANAVIGALVVTTCALALPWWDSMQVLDCQLNYVWAAALSLAAVYLILYKLPTHAGIGKIFLYSLLCGAAGMMHEACSLPLCFGLVCYAVVNRKIAWRGLSLVPVFAFALGTALATLSPGIMMRAATYVQPDDSVLWIMLKSDILAAALCIVLMVMLITPSLRGKAVMILKSKTGVLAVAAIASMAISLASGVVGRSGWFAEIFAIIVIARIFAPYLEKSKALKVVAIILAIIAVVQYMITAVWQYKLDKEFDKFEALYDVSDDGVVFMDYTRFNQVSMATMNRTRTVPDADDVYLLSTYAGYHSTDSVWPTIVPSVVKCIDVDTISRCTLPCGDIIASSLPEDVISHYQDREKLSIIITRIDDDDWVVQPFKYKGRQLYHISKRVLAPGDR